MWLWRIRMPIIRDCATILINSATSVSRVVARSAAPLETDLLLEELVRFACLVYHQEKSLAALSEPELGSIVAECGVWVDGLYPILTRNRPGRGDRYHNEHDGRDESTHTTESKWLLQI